MKKSLLLILLMTLLAPFAMRADEVIIGNEEATTSGYALPANLFYHYSLTQQLYTADEIGMAGTINSISFYYTYNTSATMSNIQVYMKNSEKESFASNTDMEAIEDGDLVYEGNFEFPDAPGWVTITLDNPFAYDGTSNLLVCFYDPTNGYPGNSFKFQYTATEVNMGISYYSDSYVPDPNDLTTFSGSKSVYKYRANIMLDITPGGGGADCPKPEALTVSDITARTAHFSMTGNGGVSENCVFAIVRATDDEPNWAELQEGEVPFEEEAGVDVDTLQPNTSYKAYLRAFCGDWENLSGAKSVSFKTPIACNVSTTLSAKTVEGNGTQAVLSWLSSETTSDWQVIYSRKSNLTDSLVVDVENDTTVLLTDLLPDSLYYAKVRANCGDYDGFSPWGNQVSFAPSDKLVIGSGTTTSTYIPSQTNYKYSLTEQIYTAEELGSADAFLSIDIYSSAAKTRTMDIYMVYTSKSDFASATDWITATAADKVFSGNVTFKAGGWTTISLDRAFIYDGQQNVAIIIDDNTGSYNGAVSFRTFSAPSQALYKYSDSDNYDPLNPSSISGTVLSVKNQIRILKGEAPTCFKPETLEMDTVTANSAIFHWTLGENETQWEWAIIKADSSLADAEWHLVDTMYAEVGGLAPNTDYEFHVRSYCSESSQSDSRSYPFYTDCAVITELPYSEDFEGVGIRCWLGGNFQSSYSTYWPSLSSTYKYEGELGLHLYACATSSTEADSCFVILPEMAFENGIQNYSLSFYAKSANSGAAYNHSLYVGVMNNDTNIYDFDIIGAVPVGDAFGKCELVLNNYTGNGNRIMLLAAVDQTSTATSKYAHFYIDNIEVFKTPACQPLAKISVSDIERRSMVLNLQPKTGVALGSYELVYSTDSLDAAALEAAAKILISDTNKYTINGLIRNTKYIIYVRTACGEEGNTDWMSISARTKNLGAGCTGEEEPVALNNSTTAKQYFPWGDYFKSYYTQQIYTAAELSAIGLQAGYISKLAFQYALSAAYTKTITMYVGATTDSLFATTSFATLEPASEPVETVFDTQGKWYEFELSNPFYWDGESNIIVGMLAMGTNYPSSGTATFYGETTTANMGLYSRTDSGTPSAVSGTKSTNRSNIRFTICGLAVPCPSVTDMSYELVGVGTTEAIVRWTKADADFLSGYDIIRSTEEISDFTGVEPTFTNIQVDSINLAGLTASTHYYVYVRANCQAEGQDEGSSDWVGIDFSTLADCPHVENLATELVDANAISVSWDKAFEEQELHFAYIVSQSELDAAALASAAKVAVDDTLAARIDELEFDTKYYIYVASVCGVDYSPWEMDSIQTLPACIQVRNLEIVRKEHNRVVLSWQKGIFAKEALWEVGIVGQEDEAITTADTTALVIGLEPATDYVAYVKAVCGEESKSLATTLPFTTAPAQGDCYNTGDGTTTGNLPVTNYNYAYTQIIYKASDIDTIGNLIGLQLQRSTYANVMNNMKVYVGLTDKDKFASTTDWVAEANLTQVYSGSFAAGTEWLALPFDAPFAYDGTQNLVVAISNGHGNWNSIQNFYYTATDSSLITRRNDDDATYANYPGTAAANVISNARTNIQFCFEDLSTCKEVADLSATKVEKTSAQISWEPMGSERSWKVLLTTDSLPDLTDAIETDAYIHAYSELTPGTKYYYFVRPAGDCEDAWISIHFTTLASCLPPSALEIGEITETSAAISWIDAYDVNEYVVAYGLKDSFDIANAATYEVKAVSGAKETILTGLLPNTAYKFAVKSVCSVEDPSVYTDAADFRTECEAIVEFPWVEDFESYTANTTITYSALYAFNEPCWINEHISGAGNKLFELNAYCATGDNNATNKLRLPDQTSGTITRLTLPEMNIPSTGYQFELDIFRNVGSTSYPQEGIRIFAAHGNDTIELAFISRNYTVADAAHGIPAETASGWYTYELVIPDTCIGLCNIILQGESKYGSHTYMDNFKVRKAPTCFKPTDLAVSDITLSGASFVWTPTGSETQWQWAIAEAGEEPLWVADEDHIVSDDSIAIGGLEASTAYDFYVRAYCAENDQSDEETISFKTLYTVPFAPEFTSTTFPSDWMRSSTPASSVFSGTAMVSASSGWSLVAASNIMDAYNFKMNIYSTGKYWLVTPAIVMPNEIGAEYVLDFDLAYDKYSSGGNVVSAPDTTGTDDRFLVVISADGGQTWLEANKTEWNNAGTGDYVLNAIDTLATPYSINMTAYAGQIIKIGFYGESSVSNTDNDIHVGHINLHVGEGGGTSIKEIDVTEKAMKFFRNGHIYILRNGVIYDATGQMVKRD